MKNPFIYLFVAVMSVLSLTSCSSDDDKAVSSSREIKYEVTGTTTATDMDVVYTTNGGGTNADVTSLPWTYTFTAESDTYAGGFNFSATDATPGDKVTLNVYQGNTKLETVEATADSDGIIVATINASFN
jgi:hypothetical protein